MAPNISAPSQFQIGNFFIHNNSVTRELCDRAAEEIASQTVTPTSCQGGSSYTVEGGKVAIQFCAPRADLDMELLQHVEHAYAGFVPHHEYRSDIGKLKVYALENIGGVCMYLARDVLQSNTCSLLRVTLDDYARLVQWIHGKTTISTN
ncbi:hypothetical protein NLG97_g638 [Lecanicillium saksenae]|uniref:Uncharacterized protein n=1 Tax=Lecanicillium saksenae TaxID=468837 RepID=A0ACC1R6M2_9HYPO|nr:hypothetical protein NLG97_g638 [Lecanicillium saksenae]